ncbi:hypothetical protein [Mycobacterium uberis]|nr:hypothetical protein [Mycobacterium uberis]
MLQHPVGFSVQAAVTAAAAGVDCVIFLDILPIKDEIGMKAL